MNTRSNGVSCGTPVLLAGAAFLLLLSSSAPLRAAVPAGPPVFSQPLTITNEWSPFEEGAMKVFRGTADGERVVTTHSHLAATRTFLWGGGPVETRIVREMEFERGVLMEASLRYFAQADDGTVYCFGELADAYQDGVVVSHEGSWLVGGATLPSDPPGTPAAVDPTVFMPAHPEVGDQFKPEDLYPVVDETVTVVATVQAVKVEGGTFKNVLRLKETSLIPGSGLERKWIASGVGVIRSRGEGERLALISTSLRAKKANE
ncbi:MAG: hypothetical protein HY812_10270 [Planctomycetes bacterium]|nr:hypothetical protein [Planctomycetota bacterium]